MPDTQTLETQVAQDEQPLYEEREHAMSESRRAAAIEAAYILEALRK